jgi:hypothetical protein
VLASAAAVLCAMACLFTYRLMPRKRMRLGMLIGIAITSLVFAVVTAWLYLTLMH